MAVAIALDAPAISESLGIRGSGGIAPADGSQGYAVLLSAVSHDEAPAVPFQLGDGPAIKTRRVVAEADRGSGD